MGMYDSIIVKEMWCPFCGSSIKNHEWQSKDGECVLAVYNSLDEFGATIPTSYHFSIIGSCRNCKEYIDLNVSNKSETHRIFADAKVKEMEDKLIKDCTSLHPNHRTSGTMGYKPYYWNCWCSICKEKGYERDIANPEMDPKYIEICEEQAKQKYLHHFTGKEQIAFLKLVEKFGWDDAFKQKREKDLAEMQNLFKGKK